MTHACQIGVERPARRLAHTRGCIFIRHGSNVKKREAWVWYGGRSGRVEPLARKDGALPLEAIAASSNFMSRRAWDAPCISRMMHVLSR